MIKQISSTLWQAIIRVFSFISKEIRIILGQPRLVFSLILGPFLILLIFGVGYSNAPRTLQTLFVVPEGSQIETSVEEFAQTLNSQITFAGITHDPEIADARLRNNEVDLVIVTPFDPATDWDNGEQSTFSLFHYEIDPIEETYIQVIGQRYTEIINRDILITAVAQSQMEATGWYEDIVQAKVHAATVREAIAAGDQLRAQNSAEALNEELSLVALAVGSGAAMLAGLEGVTGEEDTAAELLQELETLQTESEALADSTQSADNLSANEAAAADIEESLTEVEVLLADFIEMDTAVLVAPFRSETASITQVQIEPMNFYVPAVISLLLQHLAITLAGLSIIREKLGGAMELFRAAPVTAFEMLLGKYTSFLLLIGVLGAILTGLIVLGLQVPQLGSWANFTLVLAALLLASLGIGFHISLSARSDSQAIQYGMLTLLAAIFFSGFFLPLYRLVPAVRIVSWLLPATYSTVLLQDVMLRGQPPQFLLLLALFTFAIILFLLAWFRLARQLK